MSKLPQVLILGGGFAGLGAAQRLHDAAADITMVDKNDYHTFQPLLYQVATDLLAPTTVAHPIRGIFHNQDNLLFHQASVENIDLENRRVEFNALAPIDYDYLVLALGAKVNFFDLPGAEEHAFPLYTMDDAVRLKRQLLEVFETVDKQPELAEQGALNVVVVGGGPTGVETAGAIAELYRNEMVKDYPNLPVNQARVVLVEHASALLPLFKPELQQYTKEALEERGVEVLLGQRVASIGATSAKLSSGEELPARTLVWAAGMRANPISNVLGLELAHAGRVAVEPDLSLKDHPEVFVVGDIAQITDAETGRVLPQLGAVALQAGQHAGRNIARLLKGNASEAFHYLDKGTMATIGRHAAVAEMPMGLTLKGELAWLAWGVVHLALLTGVESRASALVDWSWSLFTHEHGKRIMLDD